MAFVYRDPFEQLQTELDRMVESAFGKPSAVYPPVNVFDAGDRYVVKAELPGVVPEQVDVSVEDDTLVIRGQRALTPPGDEGAYHRRERGEGQFRRIVRVPGRLATDETRATYRDGVLTVEMTKAKDERPRRVQIQAG
jgi:HSP20 family protein